MCCSEPLGSGACAHRSFTAYRNAPPSMSIRGHQRRSKSALALVAVLTAEIGECDSPALTPVTPHVSTPPRPFVLNDDPKTMSSFVLRMPVISSRHMLDMAAVSTGISVAVSLC